MTPRQQNEEIDRDTWRLMLVEERRRVQAELRAAFAGLDTHNWTEFDWDAYADGELSFKKL